MYGYCEENQLLHGRVIAGRSGLQIKPEPVRKINGGRHPEDIVDDDERSFYLKCLHRLSYTDALATASLITSAILFMSSTPSVGCTKKARLVSPNSLAI